MYESVEGFYNYVCFYILVSGVFLSSNSSCFVNQRMERYRVSLTHTVMILYRNGCVQSRMSLGNTTSRQAGIPVFVPMSSYSQTMVTRAKIPSSQKRSKNQTRSDILKLHKPLHLNEKLKCINPHHIEKSVCRCRGYMYMLNSITLIITDQTMYSQSQYC